MVKQEKLCFKNVEPNQLMTTFYGTPYIDIRIDFNFGYQML